MVKPRSSRTKRRSGNEKCTPSVRLAHLCKEHGEDNDKHQASPGPFHRRGLAGSSPTSKSPFDLCGWRRYADLRCECGNVYGRSLYVGGAGRTANSDMSGAECPVFQRFPTACREKEAAASPHWHVGGVRFEQYVCQFGKDTVGSLG